MCKSATKLSRRLLAMFLMAATACVTLFAAGEDPTGCSTSGPSLSLAVLACNPDSTCAGTVPVVGPGPVLVGQHLKYRATLTYVSGGGSNCGFSGGTLNIVLPNGSTTSVTSGGTVASSNPAGGTSLTGTCLGCLTTHPGVTVTGTSYTGPDVAYTVSASDVVAGKLTATANFLNTPDGKTWDSSVGSAGPTASTPRAVSEITCAAAVDKQVSCDAGAHWYDAADALNNGQNDDSGNAATKGCVAAYGANVLFRFVSKNTSTASSADVTVQPISCTLSDTNGGVTGFTLPSPSETSLTLPASGTAHSFTSNNLACNLQGSSVGDNTATLGSCACATPQDTGNLTGTGGSDTASYACVGVQIDKQITSTSVAPTAPDAGFVTHNEDTTKGFIDTSTNKDIAAQWLAKSLGNLALTCELKDTNTNLLSGITTGISLPANTASSTIATFTNASNKTCMDLHGPVGTPLEPDTADLVCHFTSTLADPNSLNCALTGDPADFASCAQNAAHTNLHVYDQATFDCCGVAIKKQVSCNGGAFTDFGFQTAGTDLANNSCIAHFGDAVGVRFALQNTGSLPLVCTGTSTVDGTSPLNLFDNFIAAPVPTEFTSTVNSIAAGANSSNITDSNITQCNATLATKESAGDQVTTNCECVGSTTAGATLDVTAFDEAKINCLAIGTPFSISKTCTGTSGNFTSDVKVTNGGDNSLNCTVVDQTVSTNPNGAVSCPISGGTPINMSPSPLAVNGGSGQFGDFTGTITATSTVYNEACVTCAEPSIACTGTGAGTCNAITGMTASCVSNVCNYMPNSAAQATCTVTTGDCFSRTPGYWGTHPQVTQQVLTENGGTLTVCGIPLSVTTAFGGKNLGKLGPPYSTTEDLCGTGGNDFKAANTSPQQLQLIRQCTSAALNLVATGKGNLGGGQNICDATNPLIGPMFQACCIVGPNNSAPVCNSGAKPGVISASGCEGFLDAFNNGFEGTDFTKVGLINSPAEPGQCQIANGNGDVNSRNLGPTK